MRSFMLMVALALAMGVAVMAQHPRHCQAPYEMEAHAFQMDHKEGFFRRGHIAYDAREERVSFFEEVDNSTNSRDFFHVIDLFRERRRTRFNLKTKTCTVEELKHRFHHIEIPRNATFVGDAIVGTNAFDGAGILTTHWHHQNKQENWEWYGVFTDRDIGCVPVSDDFFDQTYGHTTTQYFDVVLGIGNPNVFVPEDACRKQLARRHHHKH